MDKNSKKIKAASENKTKRLGNYSLIPWENFDSDIEILKKGYEAASIKEVIKNAVKDKVKEFSN